ncbi:MAG: hypothetical protein ABI629_01220 [bacterium]
MADMQKQSEQKTGHGQQPNEPKRQDQDQQKERGTQTERPQSGKR